MFDINSILFQRMDKQMYKEIKISNSPGDIKVFIVNNKILKKKIKLDLEKFPYTLKKDVKNKSFFRSRLLIQYLELYQRKHISISHSKDTSAVACSDKFKIGIDIESISRHLSKNLATKILKNNFDLNLEPIQVWTIMESSFKCYPDENQHFTKYTFKRENNFFVREKDKIRVKSIVTIFDNICLSLSFFSQKS
tara:strand:- start:240 stop:821 length:582 start_codon:yes stop_codon:yes gene_type:complete